MKRKMNTAVGDGPIGTLPDMPPPAAALPIDARARRSEAISRALGDVLETREAVDARREELVFAAAEAIHRAAVQALRFAAVQRVATVAAPEPLRSATTDKGDGQALLGEVRTVLHTMGWTRVDVGSERVTLWLPERPVEPPRPGRGGGRGETPLCDALVPTRCNHAYFGTLNTRPTMDQVRDHLARATQYAGSDAQIQEWLQSTLGCQFKTHDAYTHIQSRLDEGSIMLGRALRRAVMRDVLPAFPDILEIWVGHNTNIAGTWGVFFAAHGFQRVAEIDSGMEPADNVARLHEARGAYRFDFLTPGIPLLHAVVFQKLPTHKLVAVAAVRDPVHSLLTRCPLTAQMVWWDGRHIHVAHPLLLRAHAAAIVNLDRDTLGHMDASQREYTEKTLREFEREGYKLQSAIPGPAVVSAVKT